MDMYGIKMGGYTKYTTTYIFRDIIVRAIRKGNFFLVLKSIQITRIMLEIILPGS